VPERNNEVEGALASMMHVPVARNETTLPLAKLHTDVDAGSTENATDPPLDAEAPTVYVFPTTPSVGALVEKLIGFEDSVLPPEELTVTANVAEEEA
jgi:hypothetical protein